MNFLKNKKVVVFGLGVSGVSALKLLNQLDSIVFAINSGDPESWIKSQGISTYCPLENCYSETDLKNQEILKNCDLLILSPGIPRDHKILDIIHSLNIPIWGEIELGYQVIRNLSKLVPIIGITGTNGKTTTTTFLGELLNSAKKKTFVGGNIGIPFCDMVFELLTTNVVYDYILLELSSFQLESIVDFKPDIALILNLFQNHGERYLSIEDYAKAKFNIVNNMKSQDVIIIPNDYKIIADWSKNIPCTVLSFDTRAPETSFDLSKFRLPGIHNIVNLKFVVMVAEILKINKQAIQNSINSFNGVHHRIEYIDSKYPFKAYNDAKSTNWDATITAIQAMKDVEGELYLIIGGKKRGHGDSIMPYIAEMKVSVKKFFVIGEMGGEIFEEIKEQVACEKFLKLDQVLNSIISEKFSGIVLFSPGFPSFDQYSNYVERGEHFIKLVSK